MNTGWFGKDILIFVVHRKDAENFPYFFDRTEVKEVKFREATFYQVFGYGFSYDAYKRMYLEKIRSTVYELPWFLPNGGCPYLERHFPEESSRRIF